MCADPSSIGRQWSTVVPSTIRDIARSNSPTKIFVEVAAHRLAGTLSGPATHEPTLPLSTGHAPDALSNQLSLRSSDFERPSFSARTFLRQSGKPWFSACHIHGAIESPLHPAARTRNQEPETRNPTRVPSVAFQKSRDTTRLVPSLACWQTDGLKTWAPGDEYESVFPIGTTLKCTPHEYSLPYAACEYTLVRSSK